MFIINLFFLLRMMATQANNDVINVKLYSLKVKTVFLHTLEAKIVPLFQS